MSVKRLAISFSVVAVLLVIAGAMQLFYAISFGGDGSAAVAGEAVADEVVADEAVEGSATSTAVSSDSVAKRVYDLVQEKRELAASGALIEGRAQDGASAADETGGAPAVEGQGAAVEAEPPAAVIPISPQAQNLIDSGAVRVNGAPISPAQAESLFATDVHYTSGVEYINQKEFLPSGCELIALTVALRAEGFTLSPTEIAEHYLQTGSNFTKDYIGSPWKSGGGYPACIVDAANKWLDAGASTSNAYDLSGTSFEGVLSLVLLGYPVLTWTTEGMVSPSFSGTAIDGQQWYSPEHCVVVYGVEGGEVLVSDSLEGLVRREITEFAHVYEQCGSRALFVQPY